MKNLDDIFGQDVSLDEKLNALVAANGELILKDGLESAIQDIRLRVLTRLGTLFYDQEFGSLLPDYIYDENSKSNRLSLLAEVRRRVEMDPRVLVGSVSAKVLSWDENGIVIDLSWTFWETSEPQNISVSVERPGAERIVEDVSL